MTIVLKFPSFVDTNLNKFEDGILPEYLIGSLACTLILVRKNNGTLRLLAACMYLPWVTVRKLDTCGRVEKIRKVRRMDFK